MNEKRGSDATQYGVVASRRQAMDALLWQVPVLSLTAQAFLFSIALSPDTSEIGRLMAAFLSLISSIASIQLMAKHRYLEVRDSLWLEEYEKQNGLKTIHSRPPAPEGNTFTKLILSARSFHVWIFTLTIFGLFAVVILVGPESWFC